MNHATIANFVRNMMYVLFSRFPFECDESSADEDFEFVSPFKFPTGQTSKPAFSFGGGGGGGPNTVSTPNKIAELLREYQSHDMSDPELSDRILGHIDDLRTSTLSQMPKPVRDRASKSSYETRVSYEEEGFNLSEFTLLYGRCFNLSMNLKILAQCSYNDPLIGARVMSDLKTLEDSLRQYVRQESASRTLDHLAI